MDNVYICLKCKTKLVAKKDQLTCPSCNTFYNIKNGIPDFREKDTYWCNTNRETMIKMNNLAEKTGDWLGTAKKMIPNYYAHFKSFSRADVQFLWPTNKDSRILDAGSMWGGITIPAAQYHSEVVSIDKTLETLQFLSIRAKQMGFNNIYPVASSLDKIPFPDNYFDLVVLNGVLEWVALEQDVVLERDWHKHGRGMKVEKKHVYNNDPRDVQIDTLKELLRVTKPGGSIYLAIENRIGYYYLVGWPDDHMNIPFVCFLPRPLANIITKLTLNREYRTYVYTIPGLCALLKDAGYENHNIYGAFSHYISPSSIVPFEMIKKVKNEIKSGINASHRSWINQFHRTLISVIPKRFLKWLSPSVIIFANKQGGKAEDQTRLELLLRKAGLLQENMNRVSIAKMGSRQGDELSANFWVCIDETSAPKYFVKVCRSRKFTDALDNESKNLKKLEKELVNTDLMSKISKQQFYGTIDDVTFLVTNYFNAKPYKFNRLLGKWSLRSLDKKIKEALLFLTKFQKYTHTRNVELGSYIEKILNKQTAVLQKDNRLSSEIIEGVSNVRRYIENNGNQQISLCGQHGDFDFFNNILFNGKDVYAVDLEHYEEESLPFLDLVTLIFNPVLMSVNYRIRGMPISKIIKRNGLKEYMLDWLGLYSKLSGIPFEMLEIAVPLAVLEQNTKKYPSYRDPKTFPINKERAFKELMTFKLSS